MMQCLIFTAFRQQINCAYTCALFTDQKNRNLLRSLLLFYINANIC